LIVGEMECKSALVKSRIPGMDYALNPYTGCQHGCLYCYAEFMKKHTNHPEPWGEFVDVKINLVERLRHQIKKTRPGVVMIGTVTDAYQPIEEKLGLTRRCLEVLAGSGFHVSIQTKSDLVLRDLDVLKKIENKEVGLTVTCPDPAVEKSFEPDASDLDRRWEALERLSLSRVPTFAFVGPILPYFSDNPAALRSLFDKLKKRKINSIYLDKMNYLKGKWRRIKPVLDRDYPWATGFYQRVMNDEEKYKIWLKANLKTALKDSGFEPEIVF
jgi:DNA repair photolyase